VTVARDGEHDVRARAPVVDALVRGLRDSCKFTFVVALGMLANSVLRRSVCLEFSFVVCSRAAACRE